MDPTVTAAAIGVGGTVVVGITGYWASVRNTSKTTTLARESRVWDHRAAVYVDAIALVQFWQVGLDPRAADQIRDKRVPDWDLLQARLHAFGSEPVWEAMKSSYEGHSFMNRGFPPGNEPPDEDPMERIRVADDTLVDLIRAELLAGLRTAHHKRRRHLPFADRRRTKVTPGLI